MGIKSLCMFLVLLIGLYAQCTEGNYVGGFQEQRNHDQFYIPDYIRQTEHHKGLSLPDQSSNTDHLRNFDYHGHFQQLNSADPFQQLDHFSEHQQLSQQNELDKLANRNQLLLRTSPGESQQLNYQDMISYPNQFHQLTYPGHFQQHNQQSELDKFGDLSHTPFHSSDGEYHQTNYRGNLYYPSQYQQHNYFTQDHQLNQQGESEQPGNLSQLQLQLHNSTGEHQHPDYHGKLSYPSQFQKLNYPDEDHQLNQQSEHNHLNQQELHKSTGEHQQSDSHDKLSYSNKSQHLNYFDQDQLINQQGEHKKLGNLSHSYFYNSDGQTHQIKDQFQQGNQQSEHKYLNKLELHKSTGEHQQLDNHNGLSYSNQSQHLNNSDQDQLLNQQGEQEKLGNLSDSHFHNSDGETHQTNDQFQQLNNSEVGQFNQQDDLNELLNLKQPKIDNSIEEHRQINYRSVLNHPIPLQELNHFSRDQHLNEQSKTEQFENLNQVQLHNLYGHHHQENGYEFPVVQQHDEQRLTDGFQHLHEHQLPIYLKEDQQPIYRGNEVPVVQQQNEHEPSKFSRYNEQLDNPHQPGSLGHLNLNKKYGYPDNLLQLSNVGLHPQFDQRSVSQEYHPLKESQLSRYPREYGQPMSRAYGAPMSRESGTPMSRQYGEPMSREYGTPMSRQYGTPMSRQYGQPMNQGSPFLSARARACSRNRPHSFLSRSNSGYQGFPEGRWWDD